MSLELIPVVPVEAGAPPDETRASMDIFQVFVNVDGLRICRRGMAGLLRLPSFKRYGFYTVLSIAADADCEPPDLLSLAQEALAYEFAPISPTPPRAWRFQMVDWRRVGVAPPMFRRPGCIDDGWGAAWYESRDDKTRQQRYRLVRTRLWKGKGAREPNNVRPG